MAFIWPDRVMDTSTTTGTGALTVSGTAPSGWRTFSSACTVGDTFFYTVVDPTTGAWETGDGSYSSSNVVTRSTVRASSNAGALVSFAANAKNVFIDAIGRFFAQYGNFTSTVSVALPVNTQAFAATGYSLTGSNATGCFSIAATLNTTGQPDIFAINVTDTSNAGGNAFIIRGGPSGTASLIRTSMSGDTRVAGWCQARLNDALVTNGADYFAYYLGNGTGGNIGLFAGLSNPTFSTFGRYGSIYLDGASPGIPWFNNNGTTGWDRLVGETSTQTLNNKTITGYLTSATAASTYAPLAAPVFTGDARAVTPAAGDNDTSIATTAYVQTEIAYLTQNAQTATYPLVASDAGKHIYHAVAAAAATYTIPANASVPYLLGTTLTFVNDSVNNVTIAITSDTLVLSPGTTTGSRTLATGGIATAIKVTSTRWIISGTGLT